MKRNAFDIAEHSSLVCCIRKQKKDVALRQRPNPKLAIKTAKLTFARK
jgi:hypothetical protein